MNVLFSARGRISTKRRNRCNKIGGTSGTSDIVGLGGVMELRGKWPQRRPSVISDEGSPFDSTDVRNKTRRIAERKRHRPLSRDRGLPSQLVMGYTENKKNREA